MEVNSWADAVLLSPQLPGDALPGEDFSRENMRLRRELTKHKSKKAAAERKDELEERVRSPHGALLCIVSSFTGAVAYRARCRCDSAQW